MSNNQGDDGAALLQDVFSAWASAQDELQAAYEKDQFNRLAEQMLAFVLFDAFAFAAAQLLNRIAMDLGGFLRDSTPTPGPVPDSAAAPPRIEPGTAPPDSDASSH